MSDHDDLRPPFDRGRIEFKAWPEPHVYGRAIILVAVVVASAVCFVLLLAAVVCP